MWLLKTGHPLIKYSDPLKHIFCLFVKIHPCIHIGSQFLIILEIKPNVNHFTSPGRSPGRAIVLPPASASVLASALAKC